MPEFADVVRRRRMTRAFDGRPVPPELIEDLVDLASRAPSAGKTQGWHLVVLEGDETARFWDITLPPMRRGTFRWQRLIDAPVIALPLADPRAYTERYSEPDKRATGLGVTLHVGPRVGQRDGDHRGVEQPLPAERAPPHRRQRDVPEPSRLRSLQHHEVPALRLAGAGGPRRQLDELGEQIRRHRPVVEGPRHPPPAHDLGELGHGVATFGRRA